MRTFVSYAIPGIPTGCEYALMAVGLVMTFRATGVFNIAFGAQAFVSAFVFDLLNQYGPHWNQMALLSSSRCSSSLRSWVWRSTGSSSVTSRQRRRR